MVGAIVSTAGCAGQHRNTADCSGFTTTERKLQNERDAAQQANEAAVSPATRQAYRTAARALANLEIQNPACSTPEDRARAQADLDQMQDQPG